MFNTMVLNVGPALMRLLIFSSLAFSISSAHAGKNLPQTRIEVAVKGKQHEQLKKYFGPLENMPDILDDKIELMLKKLMPKAYRDGCRSMISKWGPVAKGTVSTAARVIFLRRGADNHQDILLAFTCFSDTPQFGDKYYDERLVYLAVDSLSSLLRIIPNAKPCNTCSDLNRLGVIEDTLRIDGQPGINIAFQTLHNNPCCADSSAREEVIYHFYKLEKNDLVEMAVLPFHKKEFDPNSPADTTTYSAIINHETDQSGSISKIISEYTITATQQPQRQGTLTYLWNKKSHRFEEISR